MTEQTCGHYLCKTSRAFCACGNPISDYDAIGILDGFVECEGAAHYLEACKAIAERPRLRGIACGSATFQALEAAAYAAKHGDDAAIERLESW